MELKIKPLSPKLGSDIPFPSYATPGSAAMDIRACMDEPMTLQPGQRFAVPSGFAIALPDANHVALVFARSGLAVKHGIALSNSVGVIDSDYRGEILVGLVNHSDVPYTIQPGERIAQLGIFPVTQATLLPTDTLDDTLRGEGGFGSTGKA